MFEFFGRKKFLVDYLDKFVDIHNHILPGIDDGAKNTDDSIALIRGFEQFGVSNFVATPHIMHNFYDNTPETILKALENLKGALLSENIKDVSIEASAEHMIDDNFELLLDQERVMPMRKDFLLMEMSFLQPPINFNQAIIRAVEKGFYPVLAHPERYNFIRARSGKYEEYKKQGLHFQLNLLSLGDYYDSETQKKASKLLEDGYIDFLASDVHNQKHLYALKNITLSNRLLKQILPLINNTISTFY